MENLSDEQRAIIEKIAHQNGFEDYQLIVKPGSQRGDNFMGIITSVSIKSNVRQMDLILKSAYAKKIESPVAKDVYTKEIFMYEEVFPEIDKIQKDLSVRHVFKSYPKIYGSCVSSEFLIMADIRQTGFKLWPKQVPMTSDHIALVFKEYAKLHSLGMIIKEKRPDVFQKIDDKTKTIYSEADLLTFEPFMKAMCNKLSSAVESDPRAKEVVDNKLIPKLSQYYQLYETETKYKITIIHGDCWCNNMMFRYEDGSDTPREVYLLDWQLSKISSPACDLTYFLFVSADIDQLRNYKTYLKMYHDIVSDNLTSAGLDPNKIFPFSSLEDHFRFFAVSGLTTTLCLTNVILGETEETNHIEGGNIDGLLELFHTKIAKQDEFDKRIIERVLFISDNDLMHLE